MESVSRQVRHRDGILFDLATGETVVADGRRPAGDAYVLSHAHGDHLYDADPPAVVCSALTADLAAARRPDADPPTRVDHPAIELLDSGHVAGSTAALIDSAEFDSAGSRTQPGDDGETRFLYTGDCSTRDRFYLDGFDPVPADVLVIETTYGKPEYVFPPQDAVEGEILDWLDETMDVPVLLFGYTLGRAQKLQRLVQRSERSRLFVTRAIERTNEVIESHLDVSFEASRYGRDVELGPGDALVLPAQTNNLSFVDKLVRDHDTVKAGFSGWAVDDSFLYRGDYDATFPLSDHCDFAELRSVVEAVDPEMVYTQHGFADAFATHCETELGVPAQSLKRNQSALTDF